MLELVRVVRGDVVGILLEHHEVGQLADLDAALDVLLEGGPGAVDRPDPERLVHRDHLVPAPDTALGVLAGHHGLERHHRLVGARHVVGGAGDLDVVVEEGLVGEHPLHLFFAVLHPLVPVVVDIGPERGGNRTGVVDPLEQFGVHQRAVLDAVPGVPRRFGEDFLVGVEHVADGQVAVGVNPDMEVVRVGVLDGLHDLLGSHGEDPVVVGALVGSAHVHRAARGGAVGAVLDRPDPEPLVAEATVDLGGLQSAVEVGVRGSEVVHPVAEIAGGIGVLEGEEAVGVAAGLMHAGDAGGGHQLRHVGDALPELGAAVDPALSDAVEDLVGLLLDEPGQLPVRVLLEPAARRIGHVLRDAGHLEGLRVVPVDVAAPVRDADRNVRRRLVEVVPGDPAVLPVLVGDLGVVVLEPVHPVAGLGVCGGGPDRHLDVLDGADVEVHFEEVPHPARVAVGIDEPGNHGHPAGIHDLGRRSGQVQHVLVRTHRDELAVVDGERLGLVHGLAALAVLGGVHPGVVDDHLRGRRTPARAAGGREAGGRGGSRELQEFGAAQVLVKQTGHQAISS